MKTAARSLQNLCVNEYKRNTAHSGCKFYFISLKPPLTIGSAIHRGDYQNVLLEEATRLGATVLTHTAAVDLQTSMDEQTVVLTADGQKLSADVVIGADGKHASTLALSKSSLTMTNQASGRRREISSWDNPSLLKRRAI